MCKWRAIGVSRVEIASRRAFESKRHGRTSEHISASARGIRNSKVQKRLVDSAVDESVEDEHDGGIDGQGGHRRVEEF